MPLSHGHRLLAAFILASKATLHVAAQVLNGSTSQRLFGNLLQTSPHPDQDGSSPLLRQSSFLFTHDAATGYIGRWDVDRPFAETQGVNLLQQLTCGARALDIRVLLDHDGSIRYHHGKGFAWVSSQTLDDTIPGLVEWAQEHSSELVLLVLSHCYTRRSATDFSWGDIPCTDSRIMGGFTKHGVRAETDCTTLNSLSFAEAKQHAAMDNGGRLLLFPGEGYCLDAYYNGHITKRDMVEPWVNQTMIAGRAGSSFFSVQVLVQQTFSVPVTDSAILNPEIVKWLQEGELLRGVNLLEINLICASGILIATALGANVTDEDRTACMNDCVPWCKKYACSPGTAAAEHSTFV